MAQVLSGLSGVVYYIDDILVTGRTREEHTANLQAVLQRIREHGLRLKKSKCQFFTKKMEFLGHNISPEGVKPTKSHVKGILEAPAPTNKQELSGVARNFERGFPNDRAGGLGVQPPKNGG